MAHDREREPLEFTSEISDDDLYHLTSSPAPPSRFTRLTRPILDFAREKWQSKGAQYTKLNLLSDRTESPKRWVQMVQSIVTAPRFRRYVVVYLSLVVVCFVGWKYFLFPRLKENSAILSSLDPKEKAHVGGWFGANALPDLEGMVQLRELDKALLPAAAAPEEEEGEGSSRRLVFIGDVHGCKTELEKLLKKVNFNPETDHLIFTGDLIQKGPDSLGVIDLARSYNASSVRGNHEDRVLTLRQDMIAANITDDSFDYVHPQDAKSRQLARDLSPEQAEWLNALPVILDIGQVPNIGRVVVAHAGIVPGVELDKQDPWSVMNMHTIDLPTHVPSSDRKKGVKWTKLFNKHQSLSLESRNIVTTVIYGHDSKNGLNIQDYTKGLDSGCVKGGKLTALVITDGGAQEIVQVGCKKYHGK
ncbi:Metallo-dependent phosphatase-like protein [Aspergillus karnatakaensis]|uniref:putative serine/threonine-protein phosphatase n=1 Tax=Aspergillus karnatakaensis TaxID=1810916 RepID=UPI003CCC91E0